MCMMTTIMLLFLVVLLCVCVVNARWMDSTVSYSLKAPRSVAFALYSSLDQHPRWSPWLKNVNYDRLTGLSTWTLSSLGLTYSWRANNTLLNPPYSIQWESLDGLPNKGKVEFVNKKVHELGVSRDDVLIAEDSALEDLVITLTISYDLPEAAALVLGGLGPIGRYFIQNTLLKDLQRFHQILERDMKMKEAEL